MLMASAMREIIAVVQVYYADLADRCAKAVVEGAEPSVRLALARALKQLEGLKMLPGSIAAELGDEVTAPYLLMSRWVGALHNLRHACHGIPKGLEDALYVETLMPILDAMQSKVESDLVA
jgi:hypothetical protein